MSEKLSDEKLKLPELAKPPEPGTVTPITGVNLEQLMQLPYDPVVAQAPDAGSRIKNPIVSIIAMNQMVIYERKMPHHGQKRFPVPFKEAVKRMAAVMRSLFVEDGGKPKEETEYERWLVEHTIKAAAQCAVNAGTPYTGASVQAKLNELNIAIKAIPNRK